MLDLRVFEGRSVLLLVGPESPFFYRFAKDIKKYARKVYKINLSGGCWIYYPIGAVNYRDRPEKFGSFLKNFVKEKTIDTVIMFNDNKLVHRIAKQSLKGIVNFFVVEKGYIRPGFITIEREGVNGNSPILSISREDLEKIDPKPVEIFEIKDSEIKIAFYSAVFYIAFLLLRPLFPSSSLVYKHINRLAIGRILSFFGGFYYKFADRYHVNYIKEQLFNRYYFVPLQVHNDVQVRIFSPYNDVADFIREVLTSFAKHAPKDTYIVLKHHPIDIGYRNYSTLIRNLSEELRIKNRVIYIKSGDVFALIKGCIGCVVINSTVGMSALLNLKPVKVMGTAVYDKEGLTYQGFLDNFWKDAQNYRVDARLVEKFKFLVIERALINGSLYHKINSENNAGVFYEFYYYSSSDSGGRRKPNYRLLFTGNAK